MTIDQSVEPEFRVLLVYLILMRWGCGIYFGGGGGATVASAPTPIFRRGWQIRSRLAWLIFLIPCVLFLVQPNALVLLIGAPEAVRWFAVVPATGAILFIIWCKQVASAWDDIMSLPNRLTARINVRPYCRVRHPVEFGDGMLFIAMAAISDRLWVWLFAIVAILAEYELVSSRKDVELKSLLGDRFDDYAQHSWRMFPRMPTLKKAQYQVPKRFGLAAIIALLTVLSLLFGGLNLLNDHIHIPTAIYFFAAGQVLAICIAQMVFGTAPRMISALAGAILPPAIIAIDIQLNGPRNYAVGVTNAFAMIAVVGGLLGYCIGALAAGFFLVMEWVEKWYLGNKLDPEKPGPTKD